jgi:hypothetical protein
MVIRCGQCLELGQILLEELEHALRQLIRLG